MIDPQLRDRFPILKRKVYLNSCSKGALSLDVRQAYQDYLTDWDEKGSPWEYWVERSDAARSAFAALVNADPTEVAISTSASAAISALASAIHFDGERNKVVITDFDFPTMGQIWHAQESRGARVIHVPAADDNTIPLERFEAAIDEQTAIVAITHVCFRNGSRLDVPGIVEIAHRKGALVLLDSYQALGTFPIDVRALDVDFLVGGVLKYLLGSSGMAYLYVRHALIEGLIPSALGWFSQADIFAMDVHANTPSPHANRFEYGTPPVPNIYAALAGLEFVASIGTDAIEAHLIDITGAIKAGARERGFRVTTPDSHGALITLRSHDVHRLVDVLDASGIVTSSRDDNLRISPHFYNTLHDVDCLMDCLIENQNLLDTSA